MTNAEVERALRVMDVDLKVKVVFERVEGDFKEVESGAWSNGAAKVGIRSEKLAEDEWAVRVEVSSDAGEEFVLKNLTVTAHIPSVRIQRQYLSTSPGRNRIAYASYIWQMSEVALSCNTAPFIQAYDRNGTNSLVLGFADQVREARVAHETLHHGRRKGSIEDTEFSLSKPMEWGAIRTKEYEEAVYVSRARVPQMKAVGMYRDFVDREGNFRAAHVPEAALEPVWCSFYPFIGGRVDAEAVLRNAKVAKEIGIKTILIDAGWFKGTDVDGERFPLGAMRARGDRFPNLRGTIQEIRGMGLKVVLWTAPLFWWGYPGCEATTRYRVQTGDGKIHRFLCPRVREVTEIIGGLVRDAMEEYKPDGLKIDYIDIGAAECVAKHEHCYQTVGEGMEEVLAAIHRNIVEVNPEALIEFRENYANIHNRRNANCYRVNDSPYDPDQIRRAATMMRAYAAPVPVHADYIYWHPDEEFATKAVAVASIVFGMVPTIGIDLAKASGDEIRLLKGWLSFYREHKRALALGEYDVLSYDPHYSVGRITDGGRNYFGLFSQVSPGILPVSGPEVSRVYLINGTAEGKVVTCLEGVEGKFRLVVLDRFLEKRWEAEAGSAGGELVVNCEVEVGGMVALERV